MAAEIDLIEFSSRGITMTVLLLNVVFPRYSLSGSACLHRMIYVWQGDVIKFRMQ